MISDFHVDFLQIQSYTVVDKPARLIIRFLFGFRFDKLNQATNTETAMLSNIMLSVDLAKVCAIHS